MFWKTEKTSLAFILHLPCKGIWKCEQTGGQTDLCRGEETDTQSNKYTVKRERGREGEQEWIRVNKDKLRMVKRASEGRRRKEREREDTWEYSHVPTEPWRSWLGCGAHYWCSRKFAPTGNEAASCPPHYDIISEGCTTATVYPITQATPWRVQRRTRSHSGHAHLHMYIHTRRLWNGKSLKRSFTDGHITQAHRHTG